MFHICNSTKCLNCFYFTYITGVSLLWVAILGLIVIYIYALVGFSLLRIFFAPGDYLYCSTLWQCTITVIRYGLIGDMFEVRLGSHWHIHCLIIFVLSSNRKVRSGALEGQALSTVNCLRYAYMSLSCILYYCWIS